MIDKITIKGARENNLKNINVEIPKNQLVVITGVSGSGKSSLAFNTIYEEGKRRYMESLSSYARQFLGGNEKPDVDAIEGLCPAIAIDQKTTSHNPRSTVGTVTEIYDYLRILFARIGRPYCPNGHGPIEALTPKQILNLILEKCHDNDKLILLAPVVNNQKGAFTEELNEFRKLGFLRIRIDNEFFSLDDDIKLEKSKHHQIDLVIDRIVVHHDHNTTSRLANSLETALKHGSGKVCVLINDQPTTYSASHSCKICGFSVPDLEPKLFSFNSPTGACEHCKGLGFNFEPDENKMIPDWDLSINEGGIDFFKKSVNSTSINWQAFDALLKHYHIDKNAPLKTLTTKEIKLMLYGSDEPISYSIHTTGGNIFKKHDYIEGVLALVKRLHTETSSESSREFYNKYLSEKICPYCHGKKLSPAALCVKIGHKDIIEFTNFTIVELIDFILNLKLTKNEQEIGKLALAEIVNRLTFLKDVGLGYLTLSRSAATLSGGEAQRIRLATQIGSKLTGILYVLDEPSIGLHQKDNVKLIATIQKMRDLGNTMIVVEHDLDTIAAADYVIEIGPAAGDHGGKLVAAGTPAAIMDNPHSLTGNYLTHKQTIPLPRSTRTGNGKKIIIKGATLNNLKNVEAHFPLGKLICVTGVSGSGKSTLINRILVPNLIKLINQPFLDAPKLKTIVGAEAITKVISVSQEAIGRTPRSNPATYVGVFDDIRELFASTPDAKAKGFTKSRFSFNVPGGCCEKCWGDGVIRIEMHFLPDVYITCDECNGKKYNDETLSVKYKEKSIFDVLEMTVDEALTFFHNIPNIKNKLQLMADVGLGYIKLGLNADKLSGGEAQRVKLAKFLQKRTNPTTLIVLDEPTTGLHIDDIRKLIDVLNRIVDGGATVIVIEHNLDLIKCADHIIDLGPDGGNDGGKIIATGTPQQICTKSDTSYTGEFLKKILT